jgi:stage V sporulation protein B
LSLSATLSYATVIAVFLHTFAEELGYTIYGNAASGYYVALLAPVIPIMYLDHVTDSMLKGIGEQVFSMWVNITDSVLSVVLVCILIPRMGIAGYAVVIVVMEAYNFLLSFMRLYRRIRFSLAPMRSVFLPLVCSYLAVIFTRALFPNLGSLTTPPFLIAKLVFAASATVALLAIVHAIKNIRPEKRLNARRSNNLRK